MQINTHLIRSNLHFMQGTIKKLTDKHFGFIAQEDSDKDIFFHASNLDGMTFDQLSEGDEVTFELEETPKGTAAVNIAKA